MVFLNISFFLPDMLVIYPHSPSLEMDNECQSTRAGYPMLVYKNLFTMFQVLGCQGDDTSPRMCVLFED